MQEWVGLARLQDMGRNFCQAFKGFTKAGVSQLGNKAPEEMRRHSGGSGLGA